MRMKYYLSWYFTFLLTFRVCYNCEDRMRVELVHDPVEWRIFSIYYTTVLVGEDWLSHVMLSSSFSLTGNEYLREVDRLLSQYVTR
jgi:hypothetical protein